MKGYLSLFIQAELSLEVKDAAQTTAEVVGKAVWRAA